MKTKAVSGILLTLLLAGILALTFDTHRVKAAETIYIRADGSIDPPTANITSSDNITYYFTGNNYDEIVGERSNIVIDGNGFALQGSGSGTSAGKGISLTSVSGVTIKRLNITGFAFGIYLSSSSNNTITRNIISHCSPYGIRMTASSYNTISCNNITENIYHGYPSAGGGGIQLLPGSEHNKITKNNLEGNYAYGIIISDQSSRFNDICENTITDSSYVGIYFRAQYVRVSGNHMKNNRVSIYGYIATNSCIYENVIENCYQGVVLTHSSRYNTVFGNIVNNNTYGMAVYSQYLATTHSNYIFGNEIRNNEYGLQISGSDHRFYHNNLVDNTDQVWYVSGLENVWDDGYPSGGNYWKNYTDVDMYSGPHQNETGGDGIWDHPYVIDEGFEDQDHYPLVNPWTPEEIGLLVNVTPKTEGPFYIADVIEFEAIVTNPTDVTGINLDARNVRLTVTQPLEINIIDGWTDTTYANIAPGESKNITFWAEATEAGRSVTIKANAMGWTSLGPANGDGTCCIVIHDPEASRPDWSFAIITDLHIGYDFREAPDYDGSESDIVKLARSAVRRILSEKAFYNITFVVVLGDMADNARESEFIKAREVLSSLNDPDGDGDTGDGIPYIPLIGNHDMKYHIARAHMGATADPFGEVFWDENPVNAQLINERLGGVTRQNGHNYEYQNYFFTYDNMNFLCLDLQFRRWPLARSAIGTYDEPAQEFLQYHVKAHEGEQCILLSHVPLYRCGGLLDNLDQEHICWDLIMYGGAVPTLNFAGHTHRNKEDVVVGLLDVLAYRVIETESVSQVDFEGLAQDNPVKKFEATHTQEVIRIVQMKNGEADYSIRLKPETLPSILQWPHPFFTHTFASHPEPNEPIVFTAYATTYHGFQSVYQWDFGDESTGSGSPVGHVYSQEGDFNVTLTVSMRNLLTGNETTRTVTNTIYVRNKHTISALPADLHIISGPTGEDLSEVPKNTYEFVTVTKETVDEAPTAKFWIHFEEANLDIDLSGLIADASLAERKSIVYMSSWPVEIDNYRWLLVPSSGTGSIYVCLNATSLDEVSLGNADLIINVGETENNLTVTTTYYEGQEYYLVHGNVTDFGGGEIFHDVAITDVMSRTVVGQGFNLRINVTAQNQGSFTENFNVTIFANTTSIATFTNITLASGNSTTITFNWNTTSFAYGNYITWAVADTVPGETDIADNTSIDNTVFVTIAGDVDGDGDVDGFDLTRMCGAYGSTPSNPAWDEPCDINGNGFIDGFDLTPACGNYGKTV